MLFLFFANVDYSFTNLQIHIRLDLSRAALLIFQRTGFGKQMQVAAEKKFLNLFKACSRAKIV